MSSPGRKEYFGRNGPALLITGIIVICIYAIIPGTHFDSSLSTVVEASDGRLLGAHIADDGQWRFPPADSLPEKYCEAVVIFEDRWFYAHPGVNPVSLARSLVQNIRSGTIVSGGSTLTMQVARLAGNNPPRTYLRKAIEILMALKMEVIHSKQEIMLMYASNAPFGGNVVGIDAAAWRYFGCRPGQLSWGEAALLAVLPNAPSMLYPGRNNPELIAKRNALLDKLAAHGKIDSLTCSLAKGEPLPQSIHSLPRLTPQIADRMASISPGKYRTTIDYDLQANVLRLSQISQQVNELNEIHNMAAIVIETGSLEIKAYAANICDSIAEHSGNVDLVTAPRSTGSILKPFLYAGMLSSGEILPEMLVPDVPVEFSGYSPKNYDLKYRGAVRASEALSRSLNVPAVEMLRSYTPARLLLLLQQLGFTTFTHDADHYGLSLILGGGEASLLELAGCYARLARKLEGENQAGSEIRPFYLEDEKEGEKMIPGDVPISKGAIWLAFNAMKEVNRPADYAGWKNFSSSSNLAWKTGTSFGFRDAWAIGVSPAYVVAVWAGNADGEGRPGLTGVSSAAPLMFDIASLLDLGGWFDMPENELVEVELCSKSGYRAGPDCEEVVYGMVPRAGLNSPVCPFHIPVNLSADGRYLVDASCYDPAKIIHASWFVLPPAQEWYYRKTNASYRILPPFYPGCSGESPVSQIELLYPRNLSGIYVPVESDGRKGKVIFEAAHREPGETLYWHLDNEFIEATSIIHQVGLNPSPGKHILTIVDSRGNVLQKEFEVIDK